MQDPKAEHHIEALPQISERERVGAQILNARAKQPVNRAEPGTALKLYAPPCSDPLAILLVVDRHHSPRAAMLGQECVKAIERAHIQHPQPREIGA